MKTQLFALASAALVSTAAFALEADPPAAAAKPKTDAMAPVVTGQAVAADSSTQADEYLGGGKHGCNGCCDPCHRCVWVYAEYLNWWTRNDDTPALLGSATTRGNITSVSPLWGDSVSDDPRQGFRAGGGFYPHCKMKNIGVEANFFSLGNHSDQATFNSTANLVLARPFVDATTGTQTGLILGGGTTGETAQASFRHDSRLWGGNIGLRTRVGGGETCSGCDGGACGNSCKCCVELLAGYQYYGLNEAQRIRTTQNGGRAAPTTVDVDEDFETDNSYHGGYLGFAGEYNCGKWFVGFNGRAGVGDVRQISRINGTTTTTVNGVASTTETGQLLALQSNIGRRLDNDFTWASELGVKLGIQPICWLRGWIGYDFLYIHNVNRPGGIIDPVVNRDQLAGFGANPLAPNYNPRRDAFWAHGLNAGVELKF